MAETPRRKIVPAYTRISAIEDENKRAWTVARCNRLLRPLTMSLKRLRDSLAKPGGSIRLGGRLRAEDDSDEQESSKGAMENLPKKRKRFSSKLDGFEDEEDDTGDSDWEWPALKKRPRHQYRACKKHLRHTRENGTFENRTSASRKGRPGEIVIPTPILRKAISRVAPAGEDIQFQSPGRIQLNSPSTAKKTKSRWSGFKNAGGNSALDEVIKAFSNILDATTQEDLVLQQKGAKSLFALCVQQVPNYISAETYWRKIDDSDDDSNVVEEIFTELETLGSSDASGWKHLRLLVRSQSIYMLQDLIEDLGLSCGIVKEGLDVCYEHNAFDEAAKLLEAVISTSAPFPEPPLDERNMNASTTVTIFSMLTRHSRKSGSAAFQKRIMTQLMSSGSLPLRWITSNILQKLYIETTSTNISPDREYHKSSVTLISSTIAAACGLVDRPLGSKKQTALSASSRQGSVGTIACIRSICNNVVCAAILANSSKRKSENITRSLQLACGQLIAGYRSMASELNSPQSAPVFRTILLASKLILYLLGVRSDNESPHLACLYLELLALQSRSYSGIASKGPQLDEVVQILDHLLRCYSDCHKILSGGGAVPISKEQLETRDAFHLFREIIHNLLSFALEHKNRLSGHAILFAQRLALDSTMHLADRFGSIEHEGLYREIEKSIQSFGATAERRQAKLETKTRKDVFSPIKWKWDDGICEFVARTPRLQKLPTQEEMRRKTETDVLSIKCSNIAIVSKDLAGPEEHINKIPVVLIPVLEDLSIPDAMDKRSLNSLDTRARNISTTGRDLAKVTKNLRTSIYASKRKAGRPANSELSIKISEGQEVEDEILELPTVKGGAQGPLRSLKRANKNRSCCPINSGRRQKEIDVKFLGSDLTSDELA